MPASCYRRQEFRTTKVVMGKEVRDDTLAAERPGGTRRVSAGRGGFRAGRRRSKSRSQVRAASDDRLSLQLSRSHQPWLRGLDHEPAAWTDGISVRFCG